jgi:hypothetical protein
MYRNQKAATRVPRSAGQRISKRELEEELGQQLVHSMLDDQFSQTSQALASEDESFLFSLVISFSYFVTYPSAPYLLEISVALLKLSCASRPFPFH